MANENEMTTADAILVLSRAVQRLGNADAATSMGGLEALGAAILEGSEKIATAIDGLAQAIATAHSTQPEE